jgi:hypothetical protein
MCLRRSTTDKQTRERLNDTYLHDCTLACNFEHLTFACLTVAEFYINDFGVPIEM